MEIIKRLRKIRGLANFIVLDNKDKEYILNNEEKRNLGVLEAVKRANAIAFTHDSSFRKPAGKIVIEKEGKIIFPAVPFPEVNGKNVKNVVSSSPGYTVDRYLRKKMLNLREGDATLIVGWD